MTASNANLNPTCYPFTTARSPLDTETYLPCNATAIANNQHSACCARGDKCLSNGLCQSTTAPTTSAEFQLVGCTDKTFSSSGCPQYCAVSASGLQTVYRCSTGKWCCASPSTSSGDSPDCCADPAAQFDAKEPVVYASIEPAIATTTFGIETETVSPLAPSLVLATDLHPWLTPYASLAPTSEPSADSATAETTQSSNPIALGVGIGLGIPAFILLVVGLVFLSRRFRRRQVKRQEQARTHYASESRLHLHMSSSFLQAELPPPPPVREKRTDSRQGIVYDVYPESPVLGWFVVKGLD